MSNLTTTTTHTKVDYKDAAKFIGIPTDSVLEEIQTMIDTDLWWIDGLEYVEDDGRGIVVDMEIAGSSSLTLNLRITRDN